MAFDGTGAIDVTVETLQGIQGRLNLARSNDVRVEADVLGDRTLYVARTVDVAQETLESVDCPLDQGGCNRITREPHEHAHVTLDQGGCVRITEQTLECVQGTLESTQSINIPMDINKGCPCTSTKVNDVEHDIGSRVSVPALGL
jgi:hypothetical protein